MSRRYVPETIEVELIADGTSTLVDLVKAGILEYFYIDDPDLLVRVCGLIVRGGFARVNGQVHLRGISVPLKGATVTFSF